MKKQHSITTCTAKLYKSAQCHWLEFLLIVAVHCKIETKQLVFYDLISFQVVIGIL